MVIKYPSIDQYRNAIASVQKLTRSAYGKRDETGELIENQPRTWSFPPVTFTGTVKLHGTNAAVVVKDGQVSYQSRNRVLTPDDDNAGFAAWASKHEEYWKRAAYDWPDGLILFGEWCGGNIQNNVALTGLEKMFVIFEVWSGDLTPRSVSNISPRVAPETYLITDFPTWTMTIDMENPHLSQNALVDITNAVEAECPVGKAFGVSGIGEGVVWSFLLDIIDIWHGKRGDFRTGWLNSVGVYLLYAIDLAGQLKDQIGLIFSGADSDWEWLNAVRDGFIAIKDFATDAFRVLTGGQAETYKWLNTAKQKFDEFVVVLQNFWSKLQEAWQIFYGIMEKVHEAFATVLGLFSDVDPTVGLMVLAFAKLSGVLTLAVAGFGLLARGAITAFGGIGMAAGGAAGSISAMGLALQGLRALGPWGAAVGAVGVAGTLAYQARQRSLDGVLDAQTEVERLKGDQSYDARQVMLHNRMMRLQTQEGQDYRILDQRKKGINNPYSFTSSEEASMTGAAYAKRFGSMAPNPYAIREAKAAEAYDRESAALRARPSETVRVELVGPNGQSAQAVVDKAFSDLLRENGSGKR